MTNEGVFEKLPEDLQIATDGLCDQLRMTMLAVYNAGYKYGHIVGGDHARDKFASDVSVYARSIAGPPLSHSRKLAQPKSSMETMVADAAKEVLAMDAAAERKPKFMPHAKAQDRIARLLTLYPNGWSTDGVARELQMPNNTVRGTLGRMKQNGLVRRNSEGIWLKVRRKR